MITKIVVLALFISLFLFVQGIIFYRNNINLKKIAEDKIRQIKESEEYNTFINRKYAYLTKKGADIFLLKDGITLGKWYLYKALMGLIFGIIGVGLLILIMKLNIPKVPLFIILFIIGFMFNDLMVYLQDRSSNEEMMPDIMEMSRSILYGMRGGQYISSAIKDAILVVENKRLKVALLQFKTQLDNNMTIADCLDRFEMHFDNAEISAFCTVVKSLQDTGEFNEAMDILRSNIEREEVSVNQRKNKALDSKVNLKIWGIFIGVIACLIYILFIFISQQISGI